jgi:hypothetical protein
MFAQNWISRKRERDEEDSPVALGFGEHRVVSSLGQDDQTAARDLIA